MQMFLHCLNTSNIWAIPERRGSQTLDRMGEMSVGIEGWIRSVQTRRNSSVGASHQQAGVSWENKTKKPSKPINF